MKTVGVTLVGLGAAGEQHAEAIGLVDGAQVVSGVDVEAGERPWVPGVSSLTDALGDPAVDIVAVCTPPGAREGIVLAALEAGKGVLLEKPVATSRDQLERFLEAAAAAGKPLGCMLQHRFALCSEALEREWGPRSVASVEVHRARPAARYAEGWRASSTEAVGGFIHHLAVHYADLACVLLGAPSEVHAVLDYAVDGGVETRAAVAARLSGGATLTVHASAAQWRRVQRLAVQDVDAALVLDDGYVHWGDGPRQDRPPIAELRAHVYRRMAAAVTGRGELGLADAALARGVTTLLDGVRDSGRPVTEGP